MTLCFTVVLGVLGLLVGSFLNVVVWRVPRGESIVRPPSACPSCGHEIRWFDNVPVVSWLALRARCRDCRAPISARYPLVELATGALFAGCFLAIAQSRELPWALPAYLYLAAISIALALIDLDVRRLPDAIVLPSYLVLAALLALASWQTPDWSAALRALIGGAVLFAFYFLAMVVKPGGMGFGDVKLAGILGAALAWLGWGSLAVGAFAAFFVGGIFSVLLMLRGKATRRSSIPFGPWMILGAWIGIFLGEPLWAGYLGLFA